MVSDSEQPGGRVIAALRQYGSFVNGARRRPTVPGADLAAFVRQRARGETGETSVVKLSGVVVRGSLDLGGLCESEGESRLLELVFEDCHFDAPDRPPPSGPLGLLVMGWTPPDGINVPKWRC